MEELYKAVKKELDKLWYLDKEGEGYSYQIYASYDDEMDDRTALEILKAKNPMDVFYEKTDSWYFDVEYDVIDRIFSDIFDALKEDFAEDKVLDAVRDLVSVYYPNDHYLEQEFDVDILVDSGDGNYDYVLNDFGDCYFNYYTSNRIDDAAGLMWLTRQQGYNKKQLYKALKSDTGSKFLESVYRETLNITSHMNTLTFLVRMKLKDLIDLKKQMSCCTKYDSRENPNCGWITISKETTCGLYDPWNGAGSLFEIELEKDVKLPIRFIDSALPDGGRGYSIDSIYGMCGSAWSSDAVKDMKFVKPYSRRRDA